MREATLTIVITENENGGGDLPDSAENLYLQWGPHSDLKCYADREESKEGWHVESVSVEVDQPIHLRERAEKAEANSGVPILRRLIESTKAQGGACLWSVADFQEMIDEIEAGSERMRDLKDDGRGHPSYSGGFELAERKEDREGDNVLRALIDDLELSTDGLECAVRELCRRSLEEGER